VQIDECARRLPGLTLVVAETHGDTVRAIVAQTIRQQQTFIRQPGQVRRVLPRQTDRAAALPRAAVVIGGEQLQVAVGEGATSPIYLILTSFPVAEDLYKPSSICMSCTP
jgi:hypothetical protein